MGQIPNEQLLEVGAIVVCLAMSAVFSASETAITSLDNLKAQHLREQTNGRATELDLWLHHPARVLTTILLLNNVVTILASALATDLASFYFRDKAIGIATGVTTFLVLVFGEISPKAFARANAARIVLPCLQIIRVFYYALYPLIYILSEFAMRATRRWGAQHPNRPAITQEELEFMFSVGERSGALEDMKKEMISGVFDLDETVVREVMTPRTDLVAVEKNDNMDDVVKLIIQSGHSRIPVYEETVDNIVGIIFAKDILRQMSQGSQAPKSTLTQLMREPLFVPESKPLMDVFKDLKRTKNHMAIVIDEYGGTAGVVTMEDTLEEIVGDIQDEFDSEEAQILKLDDTTYDVSGAMNITDFMEYFSLDEKTEDSEDMESEVDTLGGWVTHRIGQIPEVGQSLAYGPLSIQVTEVSRHRIERLRVSVQPPSRHDASDESRLSS